MGVWGLLDLTNFVLQSTLPCCIVRDMNLEPDLQEIERQSFQRAFFSDGLLDLMLGSFLAIWAVEAYFDQAGFGGVSFVLLMPIYMVLRKHITEPRVGVVKFRMQRRRSQNLKRTLWIGILSLSAMVAILFFLISSQDGGPPSAFTRRMAPLPLGVMFALMLTVAGFLYDVRRAFAYAMLTVLAFVITVYVNHLLTFDDLSLALGLSSLAPLLFGIAMLVKFRNRYPLA